MNWRRTLVTSVVNVRRQLIRRYTWCILPSISSFSQISKMLIHIGVLHFSMKLVNAPRGLFLSALRFVSLTTRLEFAAGCAADAALNRNIQPLGRSGDGMSVSATSRLKSQRGSSRLFSLLISGLIFVWIAIPSEIVLVPKKEMIARRT